MPHRLLLPFFCASLAAACSGPSQGTVGAVLGIQNDTGAVFVRETPEGFAADKAGLLPGDEILMIDGVYARDLGRAGVLEKLRGDAGSSVALTVVRGSEVLHVKLVRSERGPAKAAAPAEERVAP